MSMQARIVSIPLLGLLLAAAPAAQVPSETEIRAAGGDVYVYGYPLVTMELTRRVSTNVEAAKDNRAPMGQFANARTYPTASFRDVTAPNADTLYSTAWLDLSKEPYVLSLPEQADRFWMMPVLDAWTDVIADPGQRTTGNRPQKYALTGPGWNGKLPAGVKQLSSPTNLVWIIGRTYSSGTPEDLRQVHALQDKYSLAPLSAYGKPFTPPMGKLDPGVDMKTPVREQVESLDAEHFFQILAASMKQNPPSTADAKVLAEMQTIGLVPGQSYSLARLDPAVARALLDVPKAALEVIAAREKSFGTRVNGWTYSTNTGSYGTDYTQRAYVAKIGLGANLPKDAIYPVSTAGADGQPYRGGDSYVMHFAKGALPPVRGFWSLTLYDPQYFFVPNALGRYTVSERNQLKPNADGSIDIYLQNGTPGPDKESNWLPAPADRFVLMLRLYWPDENPPTILDGSWQPPAVVRQPPPAVGGAGQQPGTAP